MLRNRRFPAARRHSGPVAWLFVLLSVQAFAAGCTPTQMVAFRDHLERPPVWFPGFLARPVLSPDGRLVAVPVWLRVRGAPDSILAVMDVDSGELRTYPSPPDELWYSPSFSPDGDKLVFVRGCTHRCKGRRGFHIALLDLKTGLVTTETADSDIYKREPVFSPDGRFVVYGILGIRNIDRFSRAEYSYWWGVRTQWLRILDLTTGIERQLSFEGHGFDWGGPVLPEGFLDDRTLLISAAWPELSSPHLQQVRRLAGKEDSHNYLPYTLTFDRSFATDSPMPRLKAVDFLQTEWTKPGKRFGISFDTGKMLVRHAYGIDIGDAKGFRREASFRRYVSDSDISKSGNRVAFLLKEGRLVRQLWIFDVATGSVWRTGLKERLHERYVAQRGSG